VRSLSENLILTGIAKMPLYSCQQYLASAYISLSIGQLFPKIITLCSRPVASRFEVRVPATASDHQFTLMDYCVFIQETEVSWFSTSLYI
jgi:hypothetical protein